MKYLARATQANVAILMVIMRWLRAAGPSSYAELAAALRPTALVTEADTGLRATLEVASHIGLLDTDDSSDQWSIAGRDGPDGALERHEIFRAVVRRALLGRAVRDVHEGNEPSDVALGLTWICSLDPSRPLAWSWAEGPEQLVRDTGLTGVIANSTQWSAFRRWATALGFCTVAKRSRGDWLIPDPTAVIDECLADMPQSLTAREFVDALTSALPTVDGGALEDVIRAVGVRYDARGDATLGPAVGHALERLRLRGVLTLRESDDARAPISYRFAGQTRTFDLIVIGAADD